MVTLILACALAQGPFTAAATEKARGPFTDAANGTTSKPKPGPVPEAKPEPPKPETKPETPPVQTPAPTPAPAPQYTTQVCQCRGGLNERACLCLRSGVQCHCSRNVGSVWYVDANNMLRGKTGQKANPNTGAAYSGYIQPMHAGAASSCPACARGAMR